MKKIIKSIFWFGVLTLGLVGCSNKNEYVPSEPKHYHSIDTSQYISNDKYHVHPLTCEHKDEATEDFEKWPEMTIGEFQDIYDYSTSFFDYDDTYASGYFIAVHDFYKKPGFEHGLSNEGCRDNDLHTESINWSTIQEPTDDEDGYKEATCSTCGYTLRVTYKNNNERSHESFDYFLNDDGESYSVKINTYVTGRLIVPSEYNGKPVTVVKSDYITNYPAVNKPLYNTFVDNTGLREVVVPESVKIVENCAFGRSRDRTIVYDEHGNKTERPIETIYWNAIDAKAQYLCAENIIFGPNVKSIGFAKSSDAPSVNNGYAFNYKNRLQLNEGLKYIGENSFWLSKIQQYHVDAINEINIPATVNTICKNSFYINFSYVNLGNDIFSTKLKISIGVDRILSESFYIGGNKLDELEIVFKETVKYIEPESFSFRVKNYDEKTRLFVKVLGNETFFENGIIGSSESTSRSLNLSTNGIQYFKTNFLSTGGSYDTPELLLNEYDNAYYFGDDINPFKYLAKAKNTNIVNCDIHPDCVSIETEAFYNCESLQTINIHGSKLQRIGSNAFLNCSSLVGNTTWNGCECISDSDDYNSSLIILKAEDIPANFDFDYHSPTIIYDSAFKDSTVLKELSFNNKVTNIPVSCFENCSNLEKVYFEKYSVKNIGRYAFSKCKNLETVYYDSAECFDGACNLPASITYIGMQAFSKCEKITNIDFGDESQINTIEPYAFEFTSLYSGIIIPASAKRLYSDFCSNIENLKTISVNENNDTYFSKDGVLYAKEKIRIVSVPKALEGDLVLPNGLERVFYGTFKNRKIVSLEIPETMTRIEEETFRNCSLLTSVIIGSGITRIEYQAFGQCTSLSSITFNGTIEEWKAIDKGADWNYEVPATVVHCSNGDVTL